DGEVMPFIPGFRHLSMTLQIFEGDLDKTVAHYAHAGQLNGDESRRRTRQRARCVWNWISHWGPDEFRYQLRQTPKTRELAPDEAICLGRLTAALVGHDEIREDDLVPTMKTLCEGTSLNNKAFLPVV